MQTRALRSQNCDYTEWNAWQKRGYWRRTIQKAQTRRERRNLSVEECFQLKDAAKLFKSSAKKMGSAAGVDGIRLTDIHTAEFYDIARQTIAAIHNGTFVPSELRVAPIPRPDGRTRELSLPPAIERIIYASAATNLSQHISPHLPSQFHGGVPGHGTSTFWVALHKTASLMAGENELWLVERDIVKAFDHVSIAAVDEALRGLQLDESLVTALIRIVKPQYTRTASEGLIGLPQGNPLSPLLFTATISSNVQDLFLMDSSEVLLKPHCMVYVDNIACIAPEAGMLTDIQDKLEERLAKIALELNSNDPKNLKDHHNVRVLKDLVRWDSKKNNLVYDIDSKRIDGLKQKLRELRGETNPFKAQKEMLVGFVSSKGHVAAFQGEEEKRVIVDSICEGTEIAGDNAKAEILKAFNKAGGNFLEQLSDSTPEANW